jgi:ketosteroid isomerase-like protein
VSRDPWLSALYDRFNRGDRGGVLEAIADDFVLQDRTLPEFAEEITGRAGYEAYLDHLAASFTDLRYGVESVVEIGDRLVAKVRASLTAVGTDLSVTGTMGHVWTIRDAEATRLDIYASWEETLKAVGLID